MEDLHKIQNIKEGDKEFQNYDDVYQSYKVKLLTDNILNLDLYESNVNF